MTTNDKWQKVFPTNFSHSYRKAFATSQAALHIFIWCPLASLHLGGSDLNERPLKINTQFSCSCYVTQHCADLDSRVWVVTHYLVKNNFNIYYYPPDQLLLCPWYKIHTHLIIHAYILDKLQANKTRPSRDRILNPNASIKKSYIFLAMFAPAPKNIINHFKPHSTTWKYTILCHTHNAYWGQTCNPQYSINPTTPNPEIY